MIFDFGILPDLAFLGFLGLDSLKFDPVQIKNFGIACFSPNIWSVKSVGSNLFHVSQMLSTDEQSFMAPKSME